VFGLLERHGPDGHSRVRVRVVKTNRRASLFPLIHKHVSKDAEVHSDSHPTYRTLPEQGFIHQFVDHAEEYVRGKVHTNGIENFWSLLKRAIRGTYVAVEPFHLFRYVDEQSFRYNTRKINDGGRFGQVVGSITGKRLTYADLTGSTTPA
jgi:hypothetical protein